MSNKVEFEMTEEDLQKLKDAAKPVTYLVVGGRPPMSPQESANYAWEHLGKKMGFEYMTVESIPGKGNRFFLASLTNQEADEGEPQIIITMDGDKYFARYNDFDNLQESPAGFGDTEEEAVQDLKADTV